MADLINVRDIQVEPDLQPRMAIDMALVDEYAELMATGEDSFPPVEIVADVEDRFWLWDGFHRVLAAKQANLPAILAHIQPGDRAHAQWLSLGANRTHGLRRTNQDKRRAVETALKKFPDKSDRAIADHVGAHHNTVGKIREEMAASGEIIQIENRTVTRGGQTYHVNTANIGNSSKPAGDVDGDELKKQLRRALHCMQDADKRWAERRQKGLTNDELREAITYEWYGDSGYTGPGDEGYATKGGADPKFWLGYIGHHSRKPTLRGAALIVAVRDLMEIPMPVEAPRLNEIEQAYIDHVDARKERGELPADYTPQYGRLSAQAATAPAKNKKHDCPPGRVNPYWWLDKEGEYGSGGCAICDQPAEWWNGGFWLCNHCYWKNYSKGINDRQTADRMTALLADLRAAYVPPAPKEPKMAYAPVHQLESAVRTWLMHENDGDASKGVPALEEIKARSETGQELLGQLAAAIVNTPHRPGDLWAATMNVLEQLRQEARRQAAAQLDETPITVEQLEEALVRYFDSQLLPDKLRIIWLKRVTQTPPPPNGNGLPIFIKSPQMPRGSYTEADIEQATRDLLTRLLGDDPVSEDLDNDGKDEGGNEGDNEGNESAVVDQVQAAMHAHTQRCYGGAQGQSLRLSVLGGLAAAEGRDVELFARCHEMKDIECEVADIQQAARKLLRLEPDPAPGDVCADCGKPGHFSRYGDWAGGKPICFDCYKVRIRQEVARRQAETDQRSETPAKIVAEPAPTKGEGYYDFAGVTVEQMRQHLLDLEQGGLPTDSTHADRVRQEIARREAEEEVGNHSPQGQDDDCADLRRDLPARVAALMKWLPANDVEELDEFVGELEVSRLVEVEKQAA